MGACELELFRPLALARQRASALRGLLQRLANALAGAVCCDVLLHSTQ